MLVEDLGDEAHVLHHRDGLAVAHRDPGRLLPAVLEREEAEVGEVGDGLAGGVDPEDPAGVSEDGPVESAVSIATSIADGRPLRIRLSTVGLRRATLSVSP